MLYHEGMTVSRWLHCADGRATGHLAAGLWSTLLDGVEVEDAIDTIVEHYRETDEMLPACDLLSRSTVRALLRASQARHQSSKDDNESTTSEGVSA